MTPYQKIEKLHNNKFSRKIQSENYDLILRERELTNEMVKIQYYNKLKCELLGTNYDAIPNNVEC